VFTASVDLDISTKNIPSADSEKAIFVLIIEEALVKLIARGGVIADVRVSSIGEMVGGIEFGVFAKISCLGVEDCNNVASDSFTAMEASLVRGVAEGDLEDDLKMSAQGTPLSAFFESASVTSIRFDEEGASFGNGDSVLMRYNPEDADVDVDVEGIESLGGLYLSLIILLLAITTFGFACRAAAKGRKSNHGGQDVVRDSSMIEMMDNPLKTK